MKLLLIILCIFFLFAAQSCQKDNPVTAKPPIAIDSSTVNYQVTALGIHALRANEFYVLWLKIAPDTNWKMIAPLAIIYTDSKDSATMVGKFTFTKSLDSLQDALITLEQTANPMFPGMQLAVAGTHFLDTTKKYLTIALDSKPVLGDFSSLQGGLVFTSTSSDSLAYNHEFYLMNLQGVNKTPSIQSLPLPPQGWEYGLWATDNNFTPHENFFYGLFSTPIGHDSDSTNDFYPFPGGWKPQQMNLPTGNIIVTLEPLFYGDQLKYKGASPFTLLQFNRIRFIDKDKNYPMTNVSGRGIPSGVITFRKY